MVELMIRLYYGCSNDDHMNSIVEKLMMGLHHRSLTVVELEVGFH